MRPVQGWNLGLQVWVRQCRLACAPRPGKSPLGGRRFPRSFNCITGSSPAPIRNHLLSAHGHSAAFVLLQKRESSYFPAVAAKLLQPTAMAGCSCRQAGLGCLGALCHSSGSSHTDPTLPSAHARQSCRTRLTQSMQTKAAFRPVRSKALRYWLQALGGRQGRLPHGRLPGKSMLPSRLFPGKWAQWQAGLLHLDGASGWEAAPGRRQWSGGRTAAGRLHRCWLLLPRGSSGAWNAPQVWEEPAVAADLSQNLTATTRQACCCPTWQLGVLKTHAKCSRASVLGRQQLLQRILRCRQIPKRDTFTLRYRLPGSPVRLCLV